MAGNNFSGVAFDTLIEGDVPFTSSSFRVSHTKRCCQQLRQRSYSCLKKQNHSTLQLGEKEIPMKLLLPIPHFL